MFSERDQVGGTDQGREGGREERWEGGFPHILIDYEHPTTSKVVNSFKRIEIFQKVILENVWNSVLIRFR